ncbi:MAG: hypothetical protein UX31_C0033G0009 [Candidatus Nomurabacteria bacterium GW2011_GWA1_46_11]|uniref:Uncharacterized protein n=2 Tax=Candidatus Nomuraibacteriota TaxID=1752729 RepID=A0A0G1T1Y1_9BACT|nr:MAG: hypothetical protein UX31_C0033G0009 [Candidatus Nomurabacteria bacterium GW2011_GWA1_46_11]KKU75747.1 MAG: hypothetical protein UY01_C0005G0014 [Candidatus Nomurabacteria bacterium GW2011_GWB1_47_6]
MTQLIITFLGGSIVLILIFYGSVWLLKESTKTLLNKELEKHKRDLSKELELYKKEIDLEYEKHLSIQNRRREVFEELINSLEDMWGKEDNKESLDLNKIYGRLVLYAPDEVYKSVKDNLEGIKHPKDAKPFIYYALRKELFGDNTNLEAKDLHKHISASIVPKQT